MELLQNLSLCNNIVMFYLLWWDGGSLYVLSLFLLFCSMLLCILFVKNRPCKWNLKHWKVTICNSFEELSNMGCKHVNRSPRMCYHCLISYAFKWEVKLILKMLDLFIKCLFNILCTHLDKFETNLMSIEHLSTQKHFQNKCRRFQSWMDKINACRNGSNK